MADIINLRQARKALERRRQAEEAAANRRRAGRTKAERQKEATEQTRSEQHHEGHRLPPDDGPQTD